MALFRLIIVAAMVLLTACGDPGDDPGAGGLTADEAAQLNDAAQMLDASHGNSEGRR